MMYWGNDGWSFLGSLIMFFWWALVVLAVVWLVRYITRNTGERSIRDHQSVESALDILNKRYAKGEIDKKEYEEKRKDISD